MYRAKKSGKAHFQFYSAPQGRFVILNDSDSKKVKRSGFMIYSWYYIY